MATSEEIKSHIILNLSQAMDKFSTSQEVDRKREAINEVKSVGISILESLVKSMEQKVETFKKEGK